MPNPNTYTDTTVNNLIINVLDKNTYEDLTPSESELYLITDDGGDFDELGDCAWYNAEVVSSEGFSIEAKDVVFESSEGCITEDSTNVEDAILALDQFGQNHSFSVLSGTTEPTSSQGVDGDIYIMYSI